MSSYSRIQLEEYLKTIHVKGSVLDIGGIQNTIKGRTKSWDVIDYQILDLKEPHEGSDKPDIEVDIQSEGEEIDYDCCGIPVDEPGASEKSSSGIIPIYKIRTNREEFDTVFCIEVSEYWYNPLQALKNINVFLKEDGILYISFHLFYPVHEPRGEDCLRYTKFGIEKLMKMAGFEIEEMIPRKFKSSIIIKNVYNLEGMRGLDKNSDRIHEDQGYIVKARRV